MFEAALIESAKRKGSAQRWYILPLSMLIHMVVIGTAAGFSMWFIEDIPEPPVSVQFYSQAPPPQPPPAPPPKAATAKQTQKIEPVKPSQVTSPIVVPDTLPPPTSVPEPETGVEGGEGIPGGIPDGVVGGEILGVGIGSNLGGRGEVPLRPGGEVKEPVEISRVKPSYPEAAIKAHMQGACILEAIITKGGDVESVRVLRGLNPLLDNAAIRAVSQWKYKPATFNGRPVPVYLTVTITFTLQ